MKTTEELIVEGYQQGLSTQALAKMHGVSKSTTWRIVKRHGVARPAGRARVYSLNESAFDVVTEASAYWVGFLMADGCVTWQNNTAHVTLDASETDADHVLKFKEFLNYGGPVFVSIDRRGRHKSVKPMHRLTVTSRRLASALETFGVCPRKTYTAKVRGLEGDRNFWRGVVDGDGCVSLINNGDRKTPFVGITCSVAICSQMSRWAEAVCGKRPSVFTDGNVAQCRINGKYAVSVLRELYGNSTVHLQRKYDKAIAIINRPTGRATTCINS